MVQHQIKKGLYNSSGGSFERQSTFKGTRTHSKQNILLSIILCLCLIKTLVIRPQDSPLWNCGSEQTQTHDDSDCKQRVPTKSATSIARSPYSIALSLVWFNCMAAADPCLAAQILIPGELVLHLMALKRHPSPA